MQENSQNGFMLIEALVTCAMLMLATYFVTRCIAQAYGIEHALEQKIEVLRITSDLIEKLRARAIACENQTLSRDAYTLTLSCSNDHTMLHREIIIKVVGETSEILCVKTVILR